MYAYTADIRWERGRQVFTDGRYDRRHRWLFDGGSTVLASPSPEIVPEPLSDASCVDPEEAFVAALSSCHMLWFLHLAAEEGVVVDRYEDRPVGHMDPSEEPMWMKRVTLRPTVTFMGAAPDAPAVRALHDAAHKRCFLANSVRSEIRIQPQS